ncbi:lamin tail domain-containing protein [Haloferula sp.]|uniref:lamin tail domain-containing protein n=1 Tax=Haloferula sp. TaxID=2497595 RepID=UPI00329F2AD8
MKLRPLLLATIGMTPLTTHALGPGDIAFTGFNSDATSDLAFVALTNIPGSEVIYITDREWDGTEINTGEGLVTWTAPVGGVPAGTVVTLTDLHGTETTNLGTVTESGTFDLAGSNDSAMAYQGTDSDTPTSFLAIIANNTESSADFGDLTGTGLTPGVHTNFISGNQDVMEYTGVRTGETPMSAYLALINNDSQWIFDNGTGDQSDDDLLADLPFDTTAFVAGGPVTQELFLSLDDIEIAENGGSTTLTITRSGPTDAAASINLTSDDSGEASLPTTADFLINEDAVDVTVTGVDDSIFDGSQIVTITASGTGFFDGTTDLTVNDDFADGADLIINEIYPSDFDADPNGDSFSNGGDEFIELVNTTGSSLDISGWTISDATEVRHTFEAGTVLDQDCAILVFGTLSESITGIGGSAAVAASTGDLDLNGSDTITVKNDSDVIVMTASYETFFNFGVPTESLNLTTESMPGFYIEHSTVSGSGGTLLSPGAKVDGSAFCTQPVLALSATSTAFAENTIGTASTGTVTATPTPTSDLEVTLVSGDLSEASVPATVTILANTPSIDFPITAVDDATADGDKDTFIAASATGVVGNFLPLIVEDDGDVAPTPNLGPGSIAFVGFNTDDDGDIAFVALENIDSGQVIHFTDNEWNGQPIGGGGQLISLTEGIVIWTAPITGVAEGTVVSINDLESTPGITTTAGDVEVADPTLNLSSSGESLYAFQGSDSETPTSFLAYITTNGTEDSIANTGLIAGMSAIYLDDNADGGAYVGTRATSPTFSGYLSSIGNPIVNWDQDGSNGAQYVPFDQTPFTLGSSDAYDSWASSEGLAFGVNDGPEDDAENGGTGDGIANVLEFILGGDPLAVDPSILPDVSIDATDFIFTFNRSDDSEGITTVTFQWSTDLSFPGENDVTIGTVDSGPDGNGVTVTVVENAASPDTVTVRVPKTNAPDGSMQGRLQGSRP